ncbi:MAG: RING finger family 4 domain-containing protein, partial [Polyangiales bacterium]
CLFCTKSGTTHVLDPCRHVVCDQCFDGSNYSGCPVCGRKVDRGSPFFWPSAPREAGPESVTFKLLDLGDDPAADARVLFESLCARKQALSPDDREALKLVANLDWLPAAIPVRENIAIVFGTLFQRDDPDVVLPHARRFMTSATDVLRFLAVISGADASLQPETLYKSIRVADPRNRWWGKVAQMLGVQAEKRYEHLYAAMNVRRFKMAKLKRPLRRSLLALMEGFDSELLVEDMLRHRSYWVWAGEFLHPGEYAKRFPNVARAFAVVRGDAEFETWYAKLESSRTKDPARFVSLLEERPGELARRLDLALRTAGDPALQAFRGHLRSYSTPVLLTLHNHLPLRTSPAKTRVYWPKGAVAKGVFGKDTRAPLSETAITSSLASIDGELLRRFGEKPHFDDAVLDAALRHVMVPFNERTASPSALNLPRGSRIPVPPGKIARLFLHWCEPEKGGHTTDIDLSVGFYDDAWKHVGVCSYYQLTLDAGGARVATSAGDFTSAPFPEGSTELVDIHRDRALAAGFRYAVMVVNNYSGMAFGQLERGFAGLMLRDSESGFHFDPRTVALRFALSGSNGVYMPIVFDLREDTLHWLDVQATGGLAFNNVASSNSAITTICPTMMDYFAKGTRTSMFELAAMHAAARCRRVIVRGETPHVFVRGDEDSATFLGRILRDQADESRMPHLEKPVLAALFRGDLALPAGSPTYALFREQLTGTMAASDLLS